jgi:hypothetical protein
MVTGDNIHTARHIARDCGILTDDGIALEGPNFRHMPANELLPLLPKMQVSWRSSTFVQHGHQQLVVGAMVLVSCHAAHCVRF